MMNKNVFIEINDNFYFFVACLYKEALVQCKVFFRFNLCSQKITSSINQTGKPHTFSWKIFVCLYGQVIFFSGTRHGEKSGEGLDYDNRSKVSEKGKSTPLFNASVANCTKSSQETVKRWNIVLFYGKLMISAHKSKYVFKLHFNHIAGFCFTTSFYAVLWMRIYKKEALRVQD